MTARQTPGLRIKFALRNSHRTKEVAWLVANQRLPLALHVPAGSFVLAANPVARKSVGRVAAALTSTFLIHVVVP